jgi:AraC-like DNA-binding protein
MTSTSDRAREHAGRVRAKLGPRVKQVVLRGAAVDFSRLSRAPTFRRFCRLLRDISGLNLVLAAPGAERRDYLYAQLSEMPLCNLLRRAPEFNARCQRCDRDHCIAAARSLHGVIYQCHAGLTDFAVPLYIGRRHAGTFLGGSLLSEPPTPAGLRRLTRRLKGFVYDYRELRDAYFRMTYIPPERLQSLIDLVSLFADHCRELGSRLIEVPPSKEETAVGKARAIICQWLTEPFALADVSRAVGLAPAYFSDCFHRETGETFVGYVRRLRVERAKLLLEITAGTVTRIAEESGFGSLSNFNRSFRQVAGSSPRAYRRRLTAKPRGEHADNYGLEGSRSRNPAPIPGSSPLAQTRFSLSVLTG